MSGGIHRELAGRQPEWRSLAQTDRSAGPDCSACFHVGTTWRGDNFNKKFVGMVSW